MLKGLLLSAGIVAIWGGAALWLLRHLRPGSPLAVLAKSFAPAVPVFCLAYALTPATLGFLPAPLAATPEPLGTLDGLLALALFFLTGVQFYYHFHNSITLRLLAEFRRVPRGAMTLAQLEEACGLERLLDERLRALEHARLVRRRGDRFYPSVAGRLAAAAARLTRAVLRLNP